METWISAVRDCRSSAGVTMTIRPSKARPGKAVTVIFTGWPFCRWMNSFSMTFTIILTTLKSIRVRMGVVSFTMVPGSTKRLVTSPFMGELMIRLASWAWVRSRLALAWRTWASARAMSFSQVFWRILFMARS